MTAPTEPVMQLGLYDIALLARVHRATVTNWRRRMAERTPFPDPVTTDGQELFDADAVAGWLDVTGLGNNPEARRDLAAFAAVSDAPCENDAVFAGLTALICLQAIEGSLPIDGDDLLDLADEADPDDELLYREIEALGERLEPLARYATLLIDAEFHAAAAFESLCGRRSRSAHTRHMQAAVTPATRGLVSKIAFALAGGSALENPVFADPTGTDLLVEIARSADERGPFTVATPTTDNQASRLDRRRLRVHELAHEPLPVDDEGRHALPDRAVLLMRFPSAQNPDPADLDILRAIDNAVLDTRDDTPILVLGPDSALTGDLRSPRNGPGRPRIGESAMSDAAQQRDDILRSRRVRAIVRLPPGCLVRSPRQRLALWCIGRIDPEGADSRVFTADLADTRLTDDVIDDLVTDIMSALGIVRRRTHTLRFGRSMFTSRLLIHRGDLIGPDPRADRAAAVASLVARIDATASRLAASLPPLPRPEMAISQGDGPSVTTLGAAREERKIRVLPGHQVRAPKNDDGTGVRILGPDALIGGRVPTIDRIALTAQYPQAVYTEPGDVVFCTTPHPAAMVDDEGGAVVAQPARIVRSCSPSLPAAVLAFDINAQPSTARAWTTWTVRQTSPEQAAALVSQLSGIADHRTELLRRLGDLDDLAAALVQGVTDGSLDLTVKE